MIFLSKVHTCVNTMAMLCFAFSQFLLNSFVSNWLCYPRLNKCILLSELLFLTLRAYCQFLMIFLCSMTTSSCLMQQWFG
ncbi:unnamed protein product [Moneuplotes crassus]|uniref:Uncharacterized protein n=1 Tax=Euplotes crassus TaxID=5936 RepID=A0AAD1XMU6_EUPCR|nr:unnamed protein product [Moneuplotes crassus]